MEKAKEGRIRKSSTSKNQDTHVWVKQEDEGSNEYVHSSSSEASFGASFLERADERGFLDGAVAFVATFWTPVRR